MKKLLLCSALLSSLVLGAMEAVAVAPVSEGKATLNTLGEDAAAVTPENPDPSNPDGTGQTGLLTIDAVPNFDFQGTGLKGSFIDKVPEGHTRNAQVSDRRGTGIGWELGLKIDAFKTNEGVPLKGAKLLLPISVIPGNENESKAPATVARVEGVIDPVNGLAAGGIVTAGQDEGYGTWLAMFEDARLKIADGNAKGTYTSVFTWSLGAAPVGEVE